MVLSIGEILVDIFVEGDKKTSFPGGAPFNVASNIANFKGDISFYGAVGNDEYGHFLSSFAKNKMSSALIDVKENRATTQAIVTLNNGERSFRFVRDSGSDYLLDINHLKQFDLSKVSIVHIGSLMLSYEEGRNFYYQACEYIRNHSKCLISFDVNYRDDTDMMLKAINGDVAIAVPKLDLQNPDFILTASLANTDFLKNANDWKGVTKRGTNDFIFNYDGAKAFFGVQDNKLYISTSEKIASKAFEAAPKDAFQSAAKGKYLSASLNVGQVIKSYPGLALILRTMPKVGEITDAFERVSLTADSPKSIELSVETKKPVKDIVSTLMELVAGE